MNLMNILSKKIITGFVLTTFLFVVFFSLSLVMVHSSNSTMEENCPFSIMDTSICPQNNFATVIHHLSSYESFLSAPINMVGLVISFLLLTSVAMAFYISPPLPHIPVFINVFHNISPDLSCKLKIARWLSLLENSPSFS